MSKDRLSPIEPINSDQERNKKIYEYLLKLVDIDITSEKKRDSQLVKQWGMSNNRVFVSRVIQAIYPKVDSKSDINLPGITLNKLVQILRGIDRYRKKSSNYKTDSKFPKILTRAEKLKALRLYANILEDERVDLGFEKYENHQLQLLHKIIEDITDPNNGLSLEKINEICRYISSCLDSEVILYNSDNYEIDKVIRDNVKKIGKAYFDSCDSKLSDLLEEKIVNKIKNSIQDIEIQNGAYQFRRFLEQDIHEIRHDDITENSKRKIKDLDKQKKGIELRFNPEKFIKRLTKSVFENHILTEDFPVYIKQIEIQEVQQLVSQDENLSPKNSLFAYTVKVYFYLKDQGVREEFYEEVTGVGSPLSHAIAAMNRALLWDIQSLREYVPIAKQITFNTEIIGSSNNGPVWGNYVVGLCKRENINFTTNSCVVEDLSNGDYCGFDILDVYAKASFYARLRAIQKTGISSINYIKELKQKIQQIKLLRIGEKMLNDYPFSLEAMKSYLTINLLNHCYKLDVNKYPISQSVDPDSRWSLTEYEAHLLIAEAYLQEGLYTIGKKYLDCIMNHMENNESDINSISKIIVAKYHLCYFRYYYLTDLEDNTEKIPNRREAVAVASKHLDDAEKNLKDYVNKCNAIDELPQTNFYGFFNLMSYLYAHRAKLYFFMSNYVQSQNSKQDSTLLFKKAITYAARSGNSSLYSIWSAYQSWYYLITAYTKCKNTECNDFIDKAEALLLKALQSYEKTGRKYYESIKLESGIQNIINIDENNQIIVDIGSEDFGEVEIEGIPLIQEFTDIAVGKACVKYSSQDKNLTLNMSVLTSSTYFPNTNNILLFGTQSCILIFSIAMLKLCHHKYDTLGYKYDSILMEIESARRLFNYSWSFAEDGIDMEENKIIRWRNGENEEFKEFLENEEFKEYFKESLESEHLKGLYPHRFTQFADFGKIYFIACELILLSQPTPQYEENRWSFILGLVSKIKENSLTARKKQTGQLRYNGHFQEHFNAFDIYVRNFQKLKKEFSILEARNKVVKDIATIMCTGQIQKPSV